MEKIIFIKNTNRNVINGIVVECVDLLSAARNAIRHGFKTEEEAERLRSLVYEFIGKINNFETK